jgi:hypothetical protein
MVSSVVYKIFSTDRIRHDSKAAGAMMIPEAFQNPTRLGRTALECRAASFYAAGCKAPAGGKIPETPS